MEKIAKCSYCGNVPKKIPLTTWDSGWSTDIFICCGYGSTSIEGWNKLTAAIDYARKTAMWFKTDPEKNKIADQLAEELMVKAQETVLDEFTKKIFKR